MIYSTATLSESESRLAKKQRDFLMDRINSDIVFFFFFFFEERLRWMLDGERGLGRAASSSPSTVGPLGRVHGFRADIVVRLHPLS
jgi:hypothetical protein